MIAAFARASIDDTKFEAAAVNAATRAAANCLIGQPEHERTTARSLAHGLINAVAAATAASAATAAAATVAARSQPRLQRITCALERRLLMTAASKARARAQRSIQLALARARVCSLCRL